jgi:hypothetical protein
MDNVGSFWEYHGLWFIFFMAFFPRLTMLFATIWGGFWWWLGLIFAPRLTVAILATMYFGGTNIVLVVFTWIWALSGEITEKKVGKKL